MHLFSGIVVVSLNICPVANGNYAEKCAGSSLLTTSGIIAQIHTVVKTSP
jgi:hypothetical protein